MRQVSIQQSLKRMQQERVSKIQKAISEKQQIITNKNEHNDKKYKKQQQKKQTVVLEIDEEDQSVVIAKQIKNQKKQQKKVFVNILFYTNKIKSDPNGEYIDLIHKIWWGNYRLLEAHHGFIQWLFPNAFQSRFNSKSSPLLAQQQKQFRQNIEIAKRYVSSYMLVLQFYGIKLKCRKTGQLVRSRKPKYTERYQKTFLTSFHNHMRITRILSSLVMIGFGRYAKQLSLFIKAQIYSEQGAMKSLRRYGVWQRQWKQYQQFQQKDQDLNIYLKQLDKKQPKL